MFHGIHFIQQDENHRHVKCESKYPGFPMSKTGLPAAVSWGQSGSPAHTEAPSLAQGLVPDRGQESKSDGKRKRDR